MNGAQLKIYGGTLTELDSIGINALTFDNSRTESVPAVVTSSKRSMNYTFRNKKVDIYEISSAQMFVVNVKPGINMGKPTPEINRDKKSALQQMGHALGWFGHSASYDMTMYSVDRCDPTDRNHINLHTYDKRHLKQIYDITNF